MLHRVTSCHMVLLSNRRRSTVEKPAFSTCRGLPPCSQLQMWIVGVHGPKKETSLQQVALKLFLSNISSDLQVPQILSCEKAADAQSKSTLCPKLKPNRSQWTPMAFKIQRMFLIFYISKHGMYRFSCGRSAGSFLDQHAGNGRTAFERRQRVLAKKRSQTRWKILPGYRNC